MAKFSILLFHISTKLILYDAITRKLGKTKSNFTGYLVVCLLFVLFSYSLYWKYNADDDDDASNTMKMPIKYH